SLFQQKTKAKILSETDNGALISYFEQCFHYIYQNPAVDRMVKDVADWPYSSYPEYTGTGTGTLCAKEIFHQLTRVKAEDIKMKTMEKIDEKILDKLF
ncbi:MAG: hypothetical protein ACRDEB_06630, partial [Chitinophagaceae bacterium]